MPEAYDVQEIERKWQARWRDEGTYQVEAIYLKCAAPPPGYSAEIGRQGFRSDFWNLQSAGTDCNASLTDPVSARRARRSRHTYPAISSDSAQRELGAVRRDASPFQTVAGAAGDRLLRVPDPCAGAGVGGEAQFAGGQGLVEGLQEVGLEPRREDRHAHVSVPASGWRWNGSCRRGR